jgi:hypothetical protein
VPSYLVETYLTRGNAGDRLLLEQRARSAADALTKEGTEVRFDRSLYVPEDEVCFYVFDAPLPHEAALVAQRAGLDAVRIVEAISSEKERS